MMEWIFWIGIGAMVIGALIFLRPYLLGDDRSKGRGGEEGEPVGAEQPPQGWDARLIAGLGLLMSSAVGVGLYCIFNNPVISGGLDLPPPMASNSVQPAHQAAGGIDVLAERLRRKLEADPDNGSGWALLARSYVELDRHADAVSAFQRAVALLPDDAQLLADYADALGVVHNHQLDGKPAQLVEQALAIDPNNVKALLLAATIAYHRRDYPQAMRYWKQAIKDEPPDSALFQEIQANIAALPSALGTIMPVGAGTSSSRVSQSPPAERRDPQPAASSGVSGIVRVAPSLHGKVSPTATLFVFARAVQGPSMPVAILRSSGRDLPLSFHLDDRHSIMPTRRLSHFQEVELVARLSRSGEATPLSGDLEGRLGRVRVGASNIEILIDREIP